MQTTRECKCLKGIEHMQHTHAQHIEYTARLEGGTLECPNGCDHYASTKCWCPCHDKKKLSDFPDEISAREYFKEPPFNRETPKKCPTCGHSKEMGTVARCTSEFHKEEVQLPEKLIWDKQTANAKEIYWTVNAILDYLNSN